MKITTDIFANTTVIARLIAENDQDEKDLETLQNTLQDYSNTVSTFIVLDGKRALSIIFKPKVKLP